MSGLTQKFSLIALILVVSTARAEPGCSEHLYPLAIPLEVIAHANPGDTVPLLAPSGRPGNFSWLTWTGELGAPRLAESLRPPGNAGTGVDPEHPAARVISVGDWVQGRPGLVTQREVRQALGLLAGREVCLPVWKVCRGAGAGAAYQVCGFARFRLGACKWFPVFKWSAVFLGWVCRDPVNEAPRVDAGPDQAVNLGETLHLAAKVQDDGLPANIALRQGWSCVSGPGDVVFEHPEAAATAVTVMTNGIYCFRCQADDSLATGVDEVTVTVNGPPVVDAGADAVLIHGDRLRLAGVVTDDGLAPGGPVQLHWSVVAGPGVVDLDDPWSLTPEVAFSRTGLYRFRLTATDGGLSASDEVSINVRPRNHPPLVYAGTNQTVLFPLPARLEGVVSDDGEPADGTLHLRWELASGPGWVTFEDAAALATFCSFEKPGRHRLNLVATDGELSATNSVDVIVNAPPQVSAGPDRQGFPGQPLELEAVLSDDGLPANELRAAWTQVAGPAPVVFANATHPSTSARFVARGNYVLRITASDGHASASDDVAVSVRAEGENLPPAVSAGPDRRIALTHAVQLQGRVIDDGLPGDTPVQTVWSQVSGPTLAMIDDPADLSTTIHVTTGGAYVLQLSASDGAASSQARVRLEIYPDNQPPMVDAGPDQAIGTGPAVLRGRVSDDRRTDGAAMRVQWTLVEGPAPVTWTSAEECETRVHFSSGGVYRFRLTADDGEWCASDDLRVTVTGNQPPRVWAGEDQVIDMQPVAGGMTDSEVSVEQGAPSWQSAIGQPGLSGLWGNVSSVAVERGGLAWSGRDLVVGGSFRFAGGLEVLHLARWNGCGFEGLFDPAPADPRNPASPPLGPVTSGTAVFPLTAWGSEVFVCGGFLKDLDHDGSMDMTARWDGAHWVPWHFEILSAWVSRGAMLASSNRVWVAGQFKFRPSNAAPGQVGFNLACWQDGAWLVYGEGIRDVADEARRDSLQHAIVKALALGPDGSLYAGGRFVMATPTGLATNLVRWTGQAWEPLGPGLTGCSGYGCASEVLALALDDQGDVWAGGNFTRAGELPVNHVARWDGTRWWPVGTGMNGPVHALANTAGVICAGGEFNQTADGGTGLPYLAAWEGTRWRPLGGTGTDAAAFALASTPDGLVAGGRFTRVGSQNANRIALWGQEPAPVLEGSAPQSIPGEPGMTVETDVEVKAGHPCGKRFTVSWFVNGGAPLQVDTVSGASDLAPATLTLRHAYPAGTHTVTAVADDGAGNRSTFRTTVTLETPTLAWLSGSASDDGLPAPPNLETHWQQVEGPVPAHLLSPDQTNGLVCFSQPGSYVFRLEANDGELGAQASVRYHVRSPEVMDPPPIVEAGPEAWIDLDDVAILAGQALDDGASPLSVRWDAIAGPGPTVLVTADGGTFTNTVEAAEAVAAFDRAGDYRLRFTADDGTWVVSSERTIHVSAARNRPPEVQAGQDLFGQVGQALRLSGTVTDDGRPYGWLEQSWQINDPPGLVHLEEVDGATWARFETPGTYTLRLVAYDGRTEGSDSVAVTVVDASPPPVAELTSPADGSIITAPTEVIGSIEGAYLAAWFLETRPARGLASGSDADSDWEVIGSSAQTLNHGPLGTFDPTLRRNGLYELRLRAVDRFSRTTVSDPVAVVVEGSMKVGHVALSFVDLLLPVAGEPMRVVRSYDSRDRSPGDFGPGWRLSFGEWRLQRNAPLGRDWFASSSGALFPLYELRPGRPRVLTLTFPGGRVARFRFQPEPTVQPLVPILYPRWALVPLAGTAGTLAPVGSDLDPGGTLVTLGSWPPEAGTTRVDLLDFGLVTSGEWGGTTEALYARPERFRYTSPEGFAYEVEEGVGLRCMTDPEGNSLTVTTSAVTWSRPGGSASVAVGIERDSQGRIVRIHDPALQSMEYHYDASGRLEAYIDRAGQCTRFAYTESGRLESVIAPNGVPVVRYDYDADGRCVSETDASGACTRFVHDIGQRTETVVDALGYRTTHQFDQRENVVRTVAADGNVTEASFDDEDRMRTQVDPLGRVTRFAYDAHGNLTRWTSPEGDDYVYTHNDRRQLTGFTDPAGGSTRFHHDDRGRLTQVVDPLGHVSEMGYDNRGQVIALTNATGQVTRFDYDAFGRLARETDALGHPIDYERDVLGNVVVIRTPHTDESGSTRILTRRFRRDPLGRVVETVQPDGSTEHYELDSAGKMLALEDPLGRVTRWAYDTLGRLRARLDPDGAGEGWDYDALGRQVAWTNRNGVVTRFDHDPMGRVHAVQHPDGTSVRSMHDAAGQLIARTDARGYTTTFGHDARGRVCALTNALGEVTRLGYDAAGNLAALTDPLGCTTTWTRDAVGRLITTTLPDGTVWRQDYDPLGNPTAETDPLGAVRQRDYDELGRLARVTDPLGNTTQFEYDDLGRRVGVVDANGHRTRLGYDDLGRLVRRVLPEGENEDLERDLAGRLVRRRDFNGNVTRYDYDVLDRLRVKTPDPRLGETPVRFDYDPEGNLLAATGAAGTTRLEYDARQRLRTRSWTWNATGQQADLAYDYDPNGNVRTVTSSTPGGSSIAYDYDAADRLVLVESAHAGITRYDYDAAGDLRRADLANGLSARYDYDAARRLTGVCWMQDGVPVADFSSKLGFDGRRLETTETISTDAGPAITGRSFVYDAAGRLTAERIEGLAPALSGTLGYLYDPVGNRLKRSSTLPALGHQSWNYDANDRVTADRTDANGNTLVAFGTGQVDRFDFENRLLSRHGGDLELGLDYDPEGNYVGQYRNSASGVTFTGYLVDELSPTGRPEILEELRLDPTSTAPPDLLAAHTFGRQWIGQDRILGPASQRQFGLHDERRSIRALSGIDGLTTDRFTYDAFGSVLQRFGETPAPRQFAGEWFDSALGLVHLRARWMDPNRGRFTTRDAFPGFPDDPASLHPYAYAGNDPLNASDPSGYLTVSEVAHSAAIGAMFNSCLSALSRVGGAASGGASIEDSFEAGLDGIGTDAAEGALGGAFGLGVTRGAAWALGRLGPQLLTRTPASVITWFNRRSGSVRDAWAQAEAAWARLEAEITGRRPVAAETATQLEFEFAKDFGKNSGLVIGRGADLSAPGALGAGEYRLGWFSVQKTSGMEAEWAVNQAKLQNVMKQNLPIRDASLLSDVGGFYLNRERGLLQSSGWTCQNGYWIPPRP